MALTEEMYQYLFRGTGKITKTFNEMAGGGTFLMTVKEFNRSLDNICYYTKFHTSKSASEVNVVQVKSSGIFNGTELIVLVLPLH